jgi:hypothetical protein
VKERILLLLLPWRQTLPTDYENAEDIQQTERTHGMPGLHGSHGGYLGSQAAASRLGIEKCEQRATSLSVNGFGVYENS